MSWRERSKGPPGLGAGERESESAQGSGRGKGTFAPRGVFHLDDSLRCVGSLTPFSRPIVAVA